MKAKNWFWGIFFLVAAVFVIATQTGAFGEIGLLSIIATVLLVALLVESLVTLNFFGVFVPLAFLYMIYWQPLGLVQVSPWLLLLAAVLASSGFHIIFHRRCHDWHHEWHKDYKEKDVKGTVENIDDNNPYAKVSFGATTKYLHSDSLKSGQFFTSFGSLEVFFDQAQVSPEGAEVYLECSFGSIALYIPKQWRVKNNIHASFGGVENDLRTARPEDSAPQLTLTGTVSFGDVEIHYI